jgi:hypothetical protein
MRQIGQLNEKVMDKEGNIDIKARDEYFTKNSSQFSALNSRPQQPKVDEERLSPAANQEYTKQPAVAPQRASQSTSQKAQPNVNVSRSQSNYNMQRAQQYHSGGWQQAEPARGGGSFGGGRSGGGMGGGGRSGGGGRR